MPNSRERLQPYYEASLEEANQRQELTSIYDLRYDLQHAPDSMLTFAGSLVSNDVAVIAEYKRRSPSEGDIRPDSTVERTVSRYSKGGATAVSVLTQGRHFGGTISDIAYARDACAMPILRKDFISTAYQLYEAKAYGATAALLIVAGLSDSRLHELAQEARAIDLEFLVEVHDKTELRRALKLSPRMIGVNNRNLSSLKVDLRTADELIPRIPDGIVTVAESGYSAREPDHIRRLRALGTDAVLMGTSLMREADPATALAAWLATDRSE